MTKQKIKDDIRRVSVILKRPPSRDEYHGRNNEIKLGMFSEHLVKQMFGTFGRALEEAGFEREPLKMDYEVAKLTNEVARLKAYAKELEAESVNSRTLRDLIGSVDVTNLGEGADWMNGPRKASSGLSGIPTLFLSDIHFDEVVKPEQINGVNEYNHEIATRRIKFTFQRTVDLLKRYMVKPKYDGIVCALGGDLLSGNIHEELAETNDQRINQSILDITDLLIEGIRGLADEFGRVFVPAVVGNHGRQHKKPRAKNYVYDNYEWLVYQYINRHFKGDSRVTFLIPDGLDAYYTIYKRRYCLTHGNQFKGGSGIAGIFSPLMLGMARKQKRQVSIGQPFDVMMNGHWHQYIHTDSLIINGSIKGYDEYADSMNFPFEHPQQALFIEHPSGHVTMRMPVFCDEILKKK